MDQSDVKARRLWVWQPRAVPFYPFHLPGVTFPRGRDKAQQKREETKLFALGAV